MTAWSELGANFLRDPDDPQIGDWAVGQGSSAPDRVHLRAILTELEPCTLLDVGCGTGIELDGILAEGLKVNYTGLDLTPEFVNYCREKYPTESFMIGDVLSLSAARVYDVVSCRAVLEHLEDGERALRNLFDACKKVCVVSWFIPPGDVDEVTRTPDGFIHHYYSRAALMAAIESLRVGEFTITRYETGGQKWESWALRR